MGLFGRLFGRKDRKLNNDDTYEKNLDMLFGEVVNAKNLEALQEEEIITNPQQRLHFVERGCQQIVACSKHMEDAKKEYREVCEYIKDVETIENLPEPTRKELEYYAKRIVVLGNEKTGFRKHTSSIPEKVYATMQTREREMPAIIRSMAEDERYCENVKSDLTRIEAEKLELKYDRNNYFSYVNAMRKLTIIGFITLCIVAAMFLYAYFKDDTSKAGMNILIISTVAAVFVIGVSIANRSLMYKLKVIELKLNKLIGLSNSIKLKYVNVRVKLDYEYNTYQVANAYEMSVRYKSYLKAKKEQEAFARAADTLYHSMNSYTDMLKKLSLHDPSVWTNQVSAIIDNREMAEIKNMLLERKKRLKNTIEYNNNIITNTKEKIKMITIQDKENADEIMKIISKYEA